jgi:glycosyltransferase involved in cell wall biosynthesis
MKKNPKISLVVPAYKAAKTIGKALESLFDQDYKNFEVLVALDGKDGYDDGAYKVAQDSANKAIEAGQIKSGQYKICVIDEHVGACAARNTGGEKATGDIISFFSADFVAEPGMLRRWVEAFEDNPDADMIYGGYRFWDLDSKPGFYSEPFDLYALTCYNYIDGGFPVKREWWEKHKWDEDFKSLNDWEWVLRMALDGMKPVMIPDFTYSAQSPQKGGLSDDSSSNWLERVKQIKEKHGIPARPICFCSLEYPNEAKKLARATGQDVQINPAFKPNEYKLVYMIGFNLAAANQCAEMLAVGVDTAKIVHWMPADVRKLKRGKICDLEELGASFREFGIQSFACTTEDVKFLQQYGFHVKLKYYFAWTDHHVNGSPFKVYVPPGFEDIEKGMPDIPTTRNKREAAAELLMDAPWGEVAEAILAGKQVISNAPYDGVWTIPPQKTHPELKAAIINRLRIAKQVKNPVMPRLPREVTNAAKFRKELDRLCR